MHRLAQLVVQFQLKLTKRYKFCRSTHTTMSFIKHELQCIIYRSNTQDVYLFLGTPNFTR